jgi:hypothetical protein
MMDNSNLFKDIVYSRDAAVSYALKYALNPNPQYKYFATHNDGGGDCSNFVSQCLSAGGAPMSYDSPNPWWYKNTTSNSSRDSWSISWSVANSLYWCLKTRGKLNISGLKGIEISDMDMLEPGDVIQYENFNGIIYHSAIITAFTYEKGSKFPLISQHSFDAKNISYVKPKAKKTHFIKIMI